MKGLDLGSNPSGATFYKNYLMMKEDYFTSTAGILDHSVRNYLATVLLDHLLGEQVEDAALREQKEKYCSGLSKSIAEGCHEYAGITIAHLQEMLTLGEGDWESLDVLITLYRRYAVLRTRVDEIDQRLES